MISEKRKKSAAELFRYGIVGLSTMAVNLGLYHVLLFAGLDYRLANFIALVGCKSYGYLANKNIVFRSHCASFRALLCEMVRFIAARGLTGLIDYFGLIIAVEILGFNKLRSKYALQVIVILLNYILGKFVVFGKKQKRSA